jgi:hypothetical protein
MTRRPWIVAVLAAASLVALAAPAAAASVAATEPPDCLVDTTASLQVSTAPVPEGQPVLVGQSVTVSWTSSTVAGCFVIRRIVGVGFDPTESLPAEGSRTVQLTSVGDTRWSLRVVFAGHSVVKALKSVTVRPLPVFSPIAAAVDFTGHLDLVRVRNDGVVLRDEQVASNGARFPGWRVTYARLMSVAAELDGSGVVVEAGIDSAGEVFTSRQDHFGSTTYVDWQLTDGNLMSIAAARNANGTIELLGTDVYGSVFHRTQTAPGSLGWTPWARLDGLPMRSVAAEANADGRITMVGVTSGGAPFYRTQQAPDSAVWEQWAPLPGERLTSIAVAKGRDDRLKAFGIDGLGHLRSVTQTAPGAATWDPDWDLKVDGHFGTIAAQSDANGSIVLFGNDGSGVMSYRFDTIDVWFLLIQYAVHVDPSVPKRKALVIPVVWAAGNGLPDGVPVHSVEEIVPMINGDHWWSEVSYGHFPDWEVGAVLQTVAILAPQPSLGLCSGAFYSEIASRVDPIAAARDRNVANYDAVLYYLPHIDACNPVAGRAIGKSAFVNGGDVKDVLHELGHTRGLGHSNARACVDGANHPVALSANCTNIEYADPNSAMGNRQGGGFAAPQRAFEGWLSGPGQQVTVPATGGTYMLAPLELTAMEPGRPSLQALRINDGTTLWVEYRLKVGVDMFEVHTPGVLIYQQANTPNESYLLDMTPGSLPDSRTDPIGRDHTDADLAPGHTWVNPLGHLKITVNFANTVGAQITVSPA